MTYAYKQLVDSLKQAFPKPISDKVHDAYFVFSFLRALDRVDRMKSVVPMLGHPEKLDFQAARHQRIADEPQSLESVSEQLVDYLSGMFIWGHPRSQINVVGSPTIPSIIGGLLPSIYNPNLCSDETSRKVVQAEVEATSMSADLVGYDAEKAAGIFSFGGTAALLYGAKIGLEKACPATSQEGVREPAYLLCSDCAHYSCTTVANWIGLGEKHVKKIPTNSKNEMQTDLLESELRMLLEDGRKIACIVATMGTTDAFGIDDLETIYEIRQRFVEEFQLDYTPHIHADAVIGWAWCVFNDYNFDENPLEFPSRTNRALAGVARSMKHLKLADSLGIDFHKTGFTPYTSSLVLLKDERDLKLITRGEETTPYLFQTGEHHPGRYTLETSRSGGGPMSALANLLLFGKQGYRSLIGHLVTMAEVLRDRLEGQASISVLNRENFGPVTLFRVYPEGVDTFEVAKREQSDPTYRVEFRNHNEFNRKVFDVVHAAALKGKGVVISLTDCYRETDFGEPIPALKSYIMSPFAESQYVDYVLDSVLEARQTLGHP